MKHKLFIIISCIILSALIFVGCGNSSKEAPESGSQVSDNSNDSKDGLPPLEKDLKDLYKNAETIYYNIVFGNFNCDTSKKIEKDSFIYYKVDEPEFDSYDEFQTYLSNYFSEDFINREILSPNSVRFIKDDKGDLYMMDASRGSNIFYAGHVFHDVKTSDSQITFTATAYYSNSQEAYDGEIFYNEPENTEDFSTQNFTFALVKEENKWKFDQFTCFT